MIDFPTLKHKFSFFLDRKQTKVTLDIAANGHTHSKHFAIEGMNETSTLRSLALRFSGSRITLFTNCAESAHTDVDVGPQALFLLMDGEPVVKLFRERKYPLNFDRSDEFFEHGNCRGTVGVAAEAAGRQHQRASRKQLRNKQSEKGEWRVGDELGEHKT